jgi:uncharacterized protein YejL (UPF0352 family)
MRAKLTRWIPTVLTVIGVVVAPLIARRYAQHHDPDDLALCVFSAMATILLHIGVTADRAVGARGGDLK